MRKIDELCHILIDIDNYEKVIVKNISDLMSESILPIQDIYFLIEEGKVLIDGNLDSLFIAIEKTYTYEDFLEDEAKSYYDFNAVHMTYKTFNGLINDNPSVFIKNIILGKTHNLIEDKLIIIDSSMSNYEVRFTDYELVESMGTDYNASSVWTEG